MWHSELAFETVAAIHGERRRQAEARRLVRAARARSRAQGLPVPGWLAHVRPAAAASPVEAGSAAEAVARP